MSKAGLETLARIYADEVRKTRVRDVNMVDPGAVRTAMRARAMPGEDPRTLPEPAAITEVFVALAEPACQRHGEIVRPGALDASPGS